MRTELQPIGNMYRKFGKIWTCGFWDMRVDRQIDRQIDRQTYIHTYRHADRNTSLPYQGEVKMTKSVHCLQIVCHKGFDVDFGCISVWLRNDAWSQCNIPCSCCTFYVVLVVRYYRASSEWSVGQDIVRRSLLATELPSTVAPTSTSSKTKSASAPAATFHVDQSAAVRTANDRNYQLLINQLINRN